MMDQINIMLTMMNIDEPKQLKEDVQKLLNKQLILERESLNKTEVCPYCGSFHIKKNGTSNTVGQRYYCKQCHKSFSKATKSFTFRSKVSDEKRKSFIDYEIARLPLREEAYFLDLSITTCCFMRHKLYRAVESLHLNEKLEKMTQLDSSYFRINLKGTKPENMPGISKKRGKTSAYRGISHHKICVVTAIDENDHLIMNIAGVGSESADKYSLVSSGFDDVDLIVSDSKSSIRQFSNSLKTDNDVIRVKPAMKNCKTDSGNTLSDVNELIENCRTSSKIYHGVAARYLQDYLNFCIFRKQLLYRFKRNEIADHVFSQIKDIVSVNHEELQATVMPISLAKAYYEYHYGIFSEQHLS